MRSIILITAFFILATFSAAQEPQWEIFFPDLSGPIAVDPTDSDIIYIAPAISANNGMWKTTDGGQTWNFYDEGWGMGTPTDILVNPYNPREILVGGGPFVGIVKSIDGGETWVRADSGFTADHHGYDITDLAFDSKNELYYAADNGTYCGVFRSADGIHWERLSNFCPWKYFIDEENAVIYAGSQDGVWKSVDSGNTWGQISNGLPYQIPTGPPNYPTVWNIVQVKGSHTLYCAVGSQGIYKTLDGGENWFSVNDSLTKGLSFNGGLIVAEADTNTIFAWAKATIDSASAGGLYVSRNGGGTWEVYNYGLPDTALDFSIWSMFLDNRTNILYSSIILQLGQSRGDAHLYKLSDAVITTLTKYPHFVSQDRLTLKSYPNPFNIETTLVYSLPQIGQVTIRIFNILGEEVKALLGEKKEPGEYQINWDGRNQAGNIVPSGIYLARVQLGRKTATIKMFILK